MCGVFLFLISITSDNIAVRLYHYETKLQYQLIYTLFLSSKNTQFSMCLHGVQKSLYFSIKTIAIIAITTNMVENCIFYHALIYHKCE